jgi:hypothetical protein
MEDVLRNRYRFHGVTRGNELLLQHSDALSFISDCETLGYRIYGMDFYALQGDQVVELTVSADFSDIIGQASVAETVAAARALISRELPDGATWVSFVTEAPADQAPQSGI